MFSPKGDDVKAFVITAHDMFDLDTGAVLTNEYRLSSASTAAPARSRHAPRDLQEPGLWQRRRDLGDDAVADEVAVVVVDRLEVVDVHHQ